MRDELKDIAKELDLLVSKKLTDKEVAELKKKYPNGDYPTSISETEFPGFKNKIFVYNPKYDEFTDDEVKLLIQLKTYSKISKIHTLLFFLIIICFFIFILILISLN